MLDRERLNELLKECERELEEANEALNELMDADIENPEEFTEQADFLLEKIHKLTKEFESLLQLL